MKKRKTIKKKLEEEKKRKLNDLNQDKISFPSYKAALRFAATPSLPASNSEQQDDNSAPPEVPETPAPPLDPRPETPPSNAVTSLSTDMTSSSNIVPPPSSSSGKLPRRSKSIRPLRKNSKPNKANAAVISQIHDVKKDMLQFQHNLYQIIRGVHSSIRRIEELEEVVRGRAD
eukprot:sb/3472098/